MFARITVIPYNTAAFKTLRKLLNQLVCTFETVHIATVTQPETSYPAKKEAQPDQGDALPPHPKLSQDDSHTTPPSCR